MEENNSLPNKYDAALAKYNTHLNDADIQARVAELIEKKVPENDTEDVKKFLFNCIDLTTLNSTDSDESVMHFTEKVNKFDDEYPDLKNVAAICVYPNFAAIVKNTLEVDGVNIACVSGGVPSSQTFIEVKVAETALACRRRGRDRYCHFCRQIPEWRLRRNVRGNTGIEGSMQGTSPQSNPRNRCFEECFQHQESLYPIHVFRRGFHQDIYRKATACRHPRSRLRDVRSYQGVLSEDRHQSRLQTGRWNQHGERCDYLLHYRQGVAGRRVAG